MFRVYVLKSRKDNKRNIGFIKNLPRRLNEHNNGIVKSTKNRSPFVLIHSEIFDTKEEAMRREKFFKSRKGREFLKFLGNRQRAATRHDSWRANPIVASKSVIMLSNCTSFF